MSGGKHVMVHQWETVELVDKGGVNYFKYRCKKCGLPTLNGQPLPKPHDKKCDKAAVQATPVQNLTG